jgi:hypothetical protein
VKLGVGGMSVGKKAVGAVVEVQRLFVVVQAASSLWALEVELADLLAQRDQHLVRAVALEPPAVPIGLAPAAPGEQLCGCPAEECQAEGGGGDQDREPEPVADIVEERIRVRGAGGRRDAGDPDVDTACPGVDCGHPVDGGQQLCLKPIAAVRLDRGLQRAGRGVRGRVRGHDMESRAGGEDERPAAPRHRLVDRVGERA